MGWVCCRFLWEIYLWAKKGKGKCEYLDVQSHEKSNGQELEERVVETEIQIVSGSVKDEEKVTKKLLWMRILSSLHHNFFCDSN